MTQEDKELLFKDLCARLPYGLICNINGEDVTIGFIGGITGEIFPNKSGIGFSIYEDTIKPYLRPISSMTDEEVDNLFKILNINEDLATEWLKVNDIGIIRLFTQQGKDFYEIAKAMDYLNSIHIDYRWLIEKGLAIEVTKENNPYENGL